MKQFRYALFLFYCSITFAFSQVEFSSQNLPLSVIVPTYDYGETVESRTYLKNKLEEYVAATGPAEMLDEFSFLVLPRLVVVNQEVTGSTPQMVLIDMEMTCFVTNVKPRKEDEEKIKSIIFHSASFSLRGLGRTKELAVMNAIREVSKSRSKLEAFFTESRRKIIMYYKANCDAMMVEAEMLAKEANLSVNYGTTQGKANAAEVKFASGLNILKNIRIANTECFQSQTDKVDKILNMYDDFACNYYLSLAKNHWAVRDVTKTIEFLDKIPPSKKCKVEIAGMLDEMASYSDDPDRNIENKIRLWQEAGGLDKARMDTEAYKFLQMDTREARRLDAQGISNRDLLILK